MTTHQWVFIGIVIVIAVILLYAFCDLLGQFTGTNAFGALGMILIALIFRVGPFALIGYGIWAFFIDKGA